MFLIYIFLLVDGLIGSRPVPIVMDLDPRMPKNIQIRNTAFKTT
jgi:hypothetical protein